MAIISGTDGSPGSSRPMGSRWPSVGETVKAAVSTSMPAMASSTLVNSAGVWLRPSLLRTKIMPMRATCAICCASWPAPLGNQHVRESLALCRLLQQRDELGITGAGSWSQVISQEMSRSRRSATSRIRASCRSKSTARCAGQGVGHRR